MNNSEAIIEEIRESWRRMSENCGHDPTTYVEYLKMLNDKYAVQVEKYRKEHCSPPTEIGRGK